MLLNDSDIQVVYPKFLDREKYNATRIRKMIIDNENWQELVPKAVVQLITSINGINRIKVISQSDTRPTEH